MNPTSKKFIALFLIFSLMGISCTTITTQRQERLEPSKERKHGAKLIVTKKDGWRMEGELIAVKPNSLLLLDTEGKDLSVDIADIKVIRIVKKSNVGKGAHTGSLIGGGVGVLAVGIIGLTSGGGDAEDILKALLFWGVGCAAYGALIGAIIGAVSKRSKTIQIGKMTDPEIKYALDYLRKKARIRDYK